MRTLRQAAVAAAVIGIATHAAAQTGDERPGPPPDAPIVYKGTVASTNPPDGRVRVLVASVRFPGVPDLELTEPPPAILLMGASGRPVGGAYLRDLEPGRDVSFPVRYTVDDPSAPGQPLAMGLGPRPAGSEGTAGPKTRTAPWPAIIFPVLGRARWSDTFGAPRDNGTRSHEGQDLMAPRMRPVLAAFDGTVSFSISPASNSLYLNGRDGYSAAYLHLNNDHPGTDDGLGSDEYAIAPGLAQGDWVTAGQLVGWVGDSGNAERTAPHMHFELRTGGRVMNAAQTLRHATRLATPRLPLPAPAEPRLRGEIRLDGTVRLVDPGRSVMQIDLRSVTDARGRRRISTFPERRWVRIGGGVPLRVLGGEDATTDLSSLRTGTPVIAIGRDPGKGTLRARSVLVERHTFTAGAALAQAIRDYAARLSSADAPAPSSAPTP